MMMKGEIEGKNGAEKYHLMNVYMKSSVLFEYVWDCLCEHDVRHELNVRNKQEQYYCT